MGSLFCFVPSLLYFIWIIFISVCFCVLLDTLIVTAFTCVLSHEGDLFNNRSTVDY